MLMESTGAADLILPLSMVASLRHQSIINMNKRLKQKNRRLHDKILQHNGTQFFSMLFMKLMGYELKNSNYEMNKKCLLGEG
jgi:hypothetical protein